MFNKKLIEKIHSLEIDLRNQVARIGRLEDWKTKQIGKDNCHNSKHEWRINPNNPPYIYCYHCHVKFEDKGK